MEIPEFKNLTFGTFAYIFALREINSHHNYNIFTFFSSNENIEFGRNIISRI